MSKTVRDRGRYAVRYSSDIDLEYDEVLNIQGFASDDLDEVMSVAESHVWFEVATVSDDGRVALLDASWLR